MNSFRRELGPYDANVLLSRPPWVYTTPNRSDIPFIESKPTPLYARADGRFGIEDYILWPQSHSEAYPWAPCVLRRPPTDDIRHHQYWFLWDDLTRADWYSPPGSSWQNMGVLHYDIYNIIHNAMQPLVHRVVEASRQGIMPIQVTVALNALRATLARLRDLPMSYRDLVLQFTQAQRLALDLLAMEVFHTQMFARMMQRAQVYPLRSEFIGCHTNSPTTVENMFYAGIPVVFMRPSRILTPSQLRVRRIADDFAPVSPDIVTAEWPNNPCKRLHDGASGTRRFQMSRPHGRYFEDLVPLEDIAEPIPDLHPFITTPSVTLAQRQLTPQDDNCDFDMAHNEQEEVAPANDVRADSPPTTSAIASQVQKYSNKGSKRARNPPPAKQQMQPNSRKGKKIGQSPITTSHFIVTNVRVAAAHAAGKAIARTMPSIQGQPSAKNRNKFGPVASHLMPPYCPEWLAALKAVDRLSPNHSIPKSRTGLMYPDPGYFASVTPLNRSFAIPAWLSIRAARCGQLLYPSRAEMRVLPTPVWRYFFFIYRQEPGGPGTCDTSVPSLTDDPNTAIGAATAMFGPEAVASMNHTVQEVFWRGQTYTVLDGAIRDMGSDTIREIIWELCELNWRYELLALDKLAAPHMWVDEDTAGQRVSELLLVFAPSSSFVLTHAPFPTENSSIVATTPAARMPALAALRRVMSVWRNSPDFMGDSTSSAPAQALADVHSSVFEAKTLLLYCQTFFDYFHRAPILPCRLP